MHPQNWFQFVVDWMGLPALALLVFVLAYRRWYREFPFFFVYVIAAESVGIVRLVSMRMAGSEYARVYWISDTVLTGFAFLASYELFFKRLFPAFYRTRIYRYLFPGAALLIVVAVSSISLLTGHSSVLPQTTRIYELLRTAILFFFVLLMVVMGRRWDKQEFGIAFGFVLDVATSLALIGIWTHTSNRDAILTRLSVIAYDIACLIWLYCFWAKPKTKAIPVFTEESKNALVEAKKWGEALKDLHSTEKR